MKRTCMLSLMGIVGFLSSVSAQVRTEFLLEKGWKFTREDNPESVQPSFDDSQWQSVTVPHDWAIYGPFSIHNDKQNVAISQDGQKEAMEHAGRTGGLPFVGVGWYRTTLDIPQFAPDKKAFILFDGAMSHAQVYINGKKVTGTTHSGLTSHLSSRPGKAIRWLSAWKTCRNLPVGIREPVYIGTYM